MEPILTPEIKRLEGDIQSIKSWLDSTGDSEYESTVQMLKHMSLPHYTEFLKKQLILYKQLEDVCNEYQDIATLPSQKKYLKYKMKYLNMLQQIGGRMSEDVKKQEDYIITMKLINDMLAKEDTGIGSIKVGKKYAQFYFEKINEMLSSK